MRINLIRAGAAASTPSSRPTRNGSRALLVSAVLVAVTGAAVAAPPAMRPVDDQGLLDSVTAKTTQVITQVRDGASGLIDSAMNFLGVRYKLGGNTAETGFDCSGFTRYVFENSLGRVLPHRADEQANAPEFAKVDHKDLKPGDLVFFNTMRRTFSHVGIYLGDGKFIHAPRSGESVRIEDMNISYWARRFTGARRVPELADADGASGNGAGASMLASLTAHFAGQPSTGSGGAGAANTTLAAAALAAAAQAGNGPGLLNPSGLRLGSTLPSLPATAPTSLGPVHAPFAGALPER